MSAISRFPRRVMRKAKSLFLEYLIIPFIYGSRAGSMTSHFGEEKIIDKYLVTLPIDNRFCVDIAASDGISMSNTYYLYRNGWKGLAVECDSEKFMKLSRNYLSFDELILFKARITPGNVLDILKGAGTPRRFDLLNLDIDGYDYFVLDAILSAFRPKLICAEINEKIPPPVKFMVTYDPEYRWDGSHFFGQSISQFYELCITHKYALVELFYNNAFLIPVEINTNKALSPEDAYEAGYRSKADRKDKFPWNADMEDLLSMSAKEAVDSIKSTFSKYRNYTCSI